MAQVEVLLVHPIVRRQQPARTPLLHMMERRPVCIRTFDLRPDKLASYTHLGSAVTRPFDWRV